MPEFKAREIVWETVFPKITNPGGKVIVYGTPRGMTTEFKESFYKLNK